MNEELSERSSMVVSGCRGFVKGLIHAAFFVVALALLSPAMSQESMPEGTEQGSEATSEDANLLLALTQVAGMRVCERMRDRFRTLTAGEREKQPTSNGTLWIETCTADAQGTRLSISLGGRGWRWIYRVKERAGAQFEVSQYASFAVDLNVEGTVDANYDPKQQLFTFHFKPTAEPEINFRPLGDVEVEREGLWSSVVGGAASLFMRSPDAQAREQLRSTGRETFKERFARGYTAKLSLCSGRLDTGFGLNGNDSDTSNTSEAGDTAQEEQDEGTPAYMSENGLIMDGPHDIDPIEFSVSVNSEGPLRAELVCLEDAKQIARAFLDERGLDERELPESQALASKLVRDSQTLAVEQERVACPVVVVLRAVPEAPQEAFAFNYHVKTAPLMEPAQECENR